MKKVILFGGTFDPIHQGHIKIALAAKKQLQADEVIFILSKNPRWKTPTVNTIDAQIQIGKNEISDNLIETIDKALTAHELIKISVLKSVDSPLLEIALDVSSATNSTIVQTIGRVIVLYRQNLKKADHIKLQK